MAGDEVPAGVAWLSGELRQRQIGVGWAALRDAPGGAAEATLTVAEVDDAVRAHRRVRGPRLAGRSGGGLIGDLFSRATADEQRWLVRLLSGDLRQGALQGVMAEAVARAAGVPLPAVRRALMLRGDLGAVATAALTERRRGAGGDPPRSPAARCSRCSPPRRPTSTPRSPRSARPPSSSSSTARASRSTATAADVAVFTRTLDDVTGARPGDRRGGARPRRAHRSSSTARRSPCARTAARTRSSARPRASAAAATSTELRRTTPLTPSLFDVLHLDGDDLLDRPGEERVRPRSRPSSPRRCACRAWSPPTRRRPPPCSRTRSRAATRA